MAAHRVHHHEHPAFDAPKDTVANLAILEPIIDIDQSIGVEKNLDGVSEVESPLGIAGLALRLVPFELRGRNVGQRTTSCNPTKDGAP